MFDKIRRKFLEVIFPNRCLSCNQMIGADGLFCNDDWQKLQFITQPQCGICAYPFESEFSAAENLLCPKCLANRPSFDSTITIFCYNDQLKKIIGNLKYYDATNLSAKFGKLLWQKIAPIVQDYNLIMAVPLHKKRLRERKFNQAILLVKAILKEACNKKNGGKIFSRNKISNHNIQFYPDALLRNKYTKSQVKLSRKMREENLREAFLVNEKYCSQINGAAILLIDDVMTTGATLDNCAFALKRMGAKKVTAVTIARTILD